MEVVLDSNFVISCIKRKIDFLGQLEEQGFKILLPREVFQELKDLRTDVPHDERTAIDMALEMLGSKKMKKVSLGNLNVDQGLIALGRKGAYIATLDAAIKRAVPNRVVISNAKNAIEIERD